MHIYFRLKENVYDFWSVTDVYDVIFKESCINLCVDLIFTCYCNTNAYFFHIIINLIVHIHILYFIILQAL